MLADVFEKCRSKCLKIRKPHPIKFVSASRLAWKAALKNTKVRLDLLTDVDMLLTVEKDIRGGVCHSIYWYEKANNKYLKDCYKDKESSYLQYWDTNNFYSFGVPQSF